MNKLTVLKVSVLGFFIAALIGFLIFMTTHAGSWAEYNERCLYYERQGISYDKYSGLYQDCIAIKNILVNLLDCDPDSDIISDHITAYLEQIGTKTALALLEDLTSISFNI